jgi:predicted cobalt transporter CbtA
MEPRLLLRGALAGGVGGLLAFVFARIFAEPQIQRAIDFETAREAAASPHGHEDTEVFSRTIQADVGGGIAIVLFGFAMGLLVAVAYRVCLGRVGAVRAKPLAVLVAGGGFLALYLVPFVKYPANPPAIGAPETIRQRSALYLVMVGCSLLFLILAVWLGQRLRERFGNWNASLLAGGAFVVAIGVVMAVLPRVSEVPAGFPADVLFRFRFASVATQLIMWTAIGLVFAPLAARLLEPHGSRLSTQSPQVPAPGIR